MLVFITLNVEKKDEIQKTEEKKAFILPVKLRLSIAEYEINCHPKKPDTFQWSRSRATKRNEKQKYMNLFGLMKIWLCGECDFTAAECFRAYETFVPNIWWLSNDVCDRRARSLVVHIVFVGFSKKNL